MGAFFLNLVNRSISTGWLILAVLVIRSLLKKSPKWVPCLLWGIVAVKAVCPLVFESEFSLVLTPEPIPVKAIYSDDPSIANNPYYYRLESKIAVVENVLNPVLTDTSGPALRGNILIFAWLWLVGMAVLLIYGGISFRHLKKKVGPSILLRENLYLCDDISSPFILGVTRPRIYLPSSLYSRKGEDTMKYVVAHEKAHLKRRDHWWKALGYLLFSVYWFHPLAWLAYRMLCRDIELACDEKVIADMEREKKGAYAQTLLDCSTPRGLVRGCPLAFGEVGVKSRVRAVLDYRKPAFVVSIAAALACGAVALCFLTEPKPDEALRDPEARTWFNFFDMSLSDQDPNMDWEMEMKDFPGVTIHWFYDRVEAVEEGNATVLYSGMPVWSVAFTDLNGDGKQEICSTVSWGSGMIDARIMVYDYSAGKCYELSDRGEYDYILRVAGGRTEVLRRRCDAKDSMWEVGTIRLTRRGIRYSSTGSMASYGSLWTPQEENDLMNAE